MKFSCTIRNSKHTLNNMRHNIQLIKIKVIKVHTQNKKTKTKQKYKTKQKQKVIKILNFQKQ